MLEVVKKVLEEENEDYQKFLISLKFQFVVLEEGIFEIKNNGYFERQSNDEFLIEMMLFVRSNIDVEKKREKFEKEIKRIELRLRDVVECQERGLID